MTWTKLSDDFPDDAERDALSDAAVRTHVEALCWSNRMLLDGAIPKRHVRRFAFSDRADEAIRELVAAGWWREHDNAYELCHDVTEQRSAAQVLADRENTKQRQARWRGRHRDGSPDDSRNGVTNGVTRRDRNGVTRDGTGQDGTGQDGSTSHAHARAREDDDAAVVASPDPSALPDDLPCDRCGATPTRIVGSHRLCAEHGRRGFTSTYEGDTHV